MARLPTLPLAALLIACSGSTPAPKTTPATTGPAITTPAPAPGPTGLATIAERDLRAHVEKLASDEYRGRGTNEVGAKLAADYLAARFADYGLVPLPGRGLKVEYQLHAHGFDPAGTRVTLNTGSKPLALQAGTDFAPFSFSGNGSANAPVVFAGYGITAPELGRDDYAGLDVKGKIVLVLRHYPNEGDKKNPLARSRHTYFASKAMTAQRHGALAMLLVTDPLHHKEADDLRIAGRLRLPPTPRDARVVARGRSDRATGGVGSARRTRRGNRPRRGMGPRNLRRRVPFPAIHLSRDAAQKLVAGAGQDLTAMQRALDAGTPAHKLQLRAVDAQVAVLARKKPTSVTAHNIIGVVEGSDPALKHEYVIVGGHYDHLGAYAGPGDTIYNGADDNASGTAGVLALARAFASAAIKPRRSVAFMLFSGEEHGLLGSRAVVAQKLIPHERIAFMLNLDMIGRNPKKPIEIVGDGYASGLRQIIEAANAEIKLPLAFGGTSYSANSDHHPFFVESIPVMFFFTGLHKDYHQLSDHADKVSYARMTRLVRVAYNIVDRIAGAKTVPRFIHHIPWLGISVEVRGQGDKAQAIITAVDKDSRATRAGLRAGDVLHSVDGTRTATARSVGKAFNQIRPGKRAVLSIARAGKPVQVQVVRARRGYLGVMPSSVRREVRKRLGLPDSEGVMIRSVVAAGPAGNAGIKAGDILIRIAGRPVNLRTLGRVLARIGAGEPVQIVVIRGDKRVPLRLILGQRP